MRVSFEPLGHVKMRTPEARNTEVAMSCVTRMRYTCLAVRSGAVVVVVMMGVLLRRESDRLRRGARHIRSRSREAHPRWRSLRVRLSRPG